MFGPRSVLLAFCLSSLLPILSRPAFSQPVVRSSGLGPGVNFGNMLEAPSEGEWGLVAEAEFFAAAATRFEHLRLPISWTHHTASAAPYAIDPAFFERIDQVVALALAGGLKLIINNHHYDELNSNPLTEWDRALAIWEQIAERYQDLPDTVYFEILNEPHGAFDVAPEVWNEFAEEALAIIRVSNPTRRVLIGPVGYNSIDRLSDLQLPPDENLVLTVHYYSPFEFTHQGAEWVSPIPPTGVAWVPGTWRFMEPWENWSWATTVIPGAKGLLVRFDDGWAGLAFHNVAGGVPRPEQLIFSVDQALDLQILISTQGQQYAFPISTEDGVKTYRINLRSLPANAIVDEIVFQNFTPNPTEDFNLSRVAIRDSSGITSLIGTNRAQVFSTFQYAANWANANNVPLHIGEFGSYSQADFVSRVRWTRTVRQAAESLNMDWAYWEFAAGFGVYDPLRSRYRTGLMNAILPPPRTVSE